MGQFTLELHRKWYIKFKQSLRFKWGYVAEEYVAPAIAFVAVGAYVVVATPVILVYNAWTNRNK